MQVSLVIDVYQSLVGFVYISSKFEAKLAIAIAS